MNVLAPRPSARRRTVWPGLGFAALGVGLLAWLTFRPVHSTLNNLGAVAAGMLLVGGVAMAVWRVRLLRWLWVGWWLAVAAAFCLPGRAGDVARLRAAYVDNLRSFENVRYVWGGEGGRGVDCSGLARRAWRDALAREGLRTGNGGWLREALRQWWRELERRPAG